MRRVRRAIDQRVVRGAVGERERRAVLERNASGQREQPRRVDAGVGREAAGAHERRDGVARLEIDRDLGDGAQLEPGIHRIGVIENHL